MTRDGRGRYVSASWAPTFAHSGRAGVAGRYRAFIPDPLAEFEPELSASTSALCERAGAAVRELNASPAGLLPLEGLGRQLLRSEALASSAIEGLQLSHRRFARAGVEGQAGDFLAQEGLGCTAAMGAGGGDGGAGPRRARGRPPLQKNHRRPPPDAEGPPAAEPDRRADSRVPGL